MTLHLTPIQAERRHQFILDALLLHAQQLQHLQHLKLHPEDPEHRQVTQAQEHLTLNHRRAQRAGLQAGTLYQAHDHNGRPHTLSFDDTTVTLHPLNP